jgi:hypothetical protein
LLIFAVVYSSRHVGRLARLIASAHCRGHAYGSRPEYLNAGSRMCSVMRGTSAEQNLLLTPLGCCAPLQRFPWRTGSDDNGLLGALELVDLTFEFGDLLLSLGQGTRRICDPIDLGHQTVNQHIRLKKGH